MTDSYPASTATHSMVAIPSGFVDLEGELILPDYASGVVVFAHGSGSSRHSPRNQYVAKVIREAGFGTLLVDLLTQKEEQQDAITGALRFDIDLLAQRLIGVTRWLEKQPATRSLKVGYFGASTGAAAALIAAAELGDRIAAIVSRGGRPDLAGNALHLVRAPTLLIVGGYDEMVIFLNNEAYDKMHCVKEIRIIPGATHLFEEPGKLGAVAQLSTDWFITHLGTSDDEEEDT
jgi:putative phosphoribosyl transferase